MELKTTVRELKNLNVYDKFCQIRNISTFILLDTTDIYLTDKEIDQLGVLNR